MQFYSQNGQDKFLLKLFKNKKEGFFLDVGAYDGRYYSNTWLFEKDMNWNGICIEPNPSVFEKLEKNRRCVTINCCVYKSAGFFNFLLVEGYGEMLSGLIDTFDKNHLERVDKIIQEHGGNKKVIKVKAVPIHTLLEQNCVRIIDYCNIDVEGGEMDVLESIDFSKVEIKIFTIENNYSKNDVRNYLTQKGYKLISKIGCDEVYELNSKRYGIMIAWKFNKLINYLKLAFKSLNKKRFVFGK
ncbi:MAG: FkbM family methyltransferase [Ginsengibacter sp.]